MMMVMMMMTWRRLSGVVDVSKWDMMVGEESGCGVSW
jgi:hypothetical protein